MDSLSPPANQIRFPTLNVSLSLYNILKKSQTLNLILDRNNNVIHHIRKKRPINL